MSPDATEVLNKPLLDVPEQLLLDATNSMEADENAHGSKLPMLPDEIVEANITPTKEDAMVQHSELTHLEAENTESVPTQELTEQTGDTLVTTETMGSETDNITSESTQLVDSAQTPLTDLTTERIIGEISYSDRSDVTHQEMSLVPSYFKPLEMSSVVSDLPEFSHTPETTLTNSSSSSGCSPPQQNTTSDTNNNELVNSSVTDSSVSSKNKRD